MKPSAVVGTPVAGSTSIAPACRLIDATQNHASLPTVFVGVSVMIPPQAGEHASSGFGAFSYVIVPVGPGSSTGAAEPHTATVGRSMLLGATHAAFAHVNSQVTS